MYNIGFPIVVLRVRDKINKNPKSHDFSGNSGKFMILLIFEENGGRVYLKDLVIKAVLIGVGI